MRYDRVQIWGDSILRGVVYDEARRRYVLLKDSAAALVTREVALPIANHSQMGRTAPEGLGIFKQDDSIIDNTLVLIEYGGNDCDLDWAAVADAPLASHQPRTPVALFIDALTQMVDLTRLRGGIPVLCTLPPLNAQRYLDWVTRDGVSRERILQFIGVTERIYRWQEYYSSLVQRVAHNTQCACLPIRDRFLEFVRGEDVLCLDGIHPNREGHRLIADAALEALRGVRDGAGERLGSAAP